MANFTPISFKKNDHYTTPKQAWDDIKEFIPQNKIIWEPFYHDGKSGVFLAGLGFDVIHEDINFFNSNRGDIIVSNPPFSRIKDIMLRLEILDKPFILILPSSKINTKYFRRWKNKIDIIIPKKRINFISNDPRKKHCNFDCFYYCYKIDTVKGIVWL